MDIGRCLRDAWKLLVKDLGPLALITVISALIVAVAGGAASLAWDQLTFDEADTDLAWYDLAAPILLSTIVVVVAEAWALGAMLKIMIRRVREDRAAHFGDLRLGLDGYGSFVVAMAVLTVLIGLGFVVFIVPGIILVTIWCYVLVVMADKRQGLGDAMSQSKELADRQGFGVTLLTLLAGGLVVGVVASILVFTMVGGLAVVFLIVYLTAYLVAMYFQAIGETALLDHALHSAPLNAGQAEYVADVTAAYPPAQPGPRAPEFAGSWTLQPPQQGASTTGGTQGGDGAPRTTLPGFGDITRTPTIATVGFACGVCALAASISPIIGIFLTPVPAILAIVLGAVGLWQAFNRGAPKRLAVAGVLCGLAAPAIAVALMYAMNGWA